ncbi:potassium channel family protein [Actinomadura parmotrematis]|uniref:Potassium channel family protein n=1 Tax=Actinomadura parmotrematis TaxID=2864039 RepID=A0ABS7FL77_9ACTN|nr:potassium channel family protein [Actinomadura parmotrematis]MBW8480780.1 potassium channel family protein [Actinomadura parmotrematis]
MSDRRQGARPPRVLLPRRRVGPFQAVLGRVLAANLLLLVIVLVVYAGRGGYRDGAGGPLSMLDCWYYATVTASTTGYGDITPVSPAARLVNIVVITPLRVMFLIVLVGTTLEVLAERTRDELRQNRWRNRVRDHYVVAGYGTKGRSAVKALLHMGVRHDLIVVVDPDPRAVGDAAEKGFVGIVGDATRSAVLKRAGVPTARQVVVATARDDTAVLVTLTARQLNPGAGIQASVRESENAPLVRQSGADHVVTSSEAAGRMLGMSTTHPHVSEIIEDLLDQGSGLDLRERPVHPGEVGGPITATRQPALALVRDGRLLPYDDRACAVLREGDRVVVATSSPRLRPWSLGEQEDDDGAADDGGDAGDR